MPGELLDDLLLPGLLVGGGARARVENHGHIDHTRAVAQLLTLDRSDVMEHRPARQTGARALGRRGITVLSLVLIILAVIVVAVVLTRTLAH